MLYYVHVKLTPEKTAKKEGDFPKRNSICSQINDYGDSKGVKSGHVWFGSIIATLADFIP